MVIAFSLLGVMENDSDIAAEHKFESKKPSVIHGICCYSFSCRTGTLVAANDLDVKYPHDSKRKEMSHVAKEPGHCKARRAARLHVRPWAKPKPWINSSF